MANTFNIENTFRMKTEKKWPEIYFCIDLHGTIIPSGRDSNDQTDEMKFYPGAKEVLQKLTARKDIFLILWTSTPPERAATVLKQFADEGITFDFFNENPHARNTPRSDFGKKFYFNVLLDDRAGFEPETGWIDIKNCLINLGEW